MKVLLFLLIIVSTFSQAKEKNSIYVEGECFKKISPDKASILFRVSEIDMKRSKSVSRATKKYNSLRLKVKSLKLKNLELTNEIYRVFPEKKWENSKEVYKGIRSEMALRVKTSDLDRVGALLSIATPLKIAETSGPKFIVSRSLHKDVYRSCLSVASTDARAKAKILAKELNVTLGKAHSIAERASSFNPSPRGPVRMESQAKGARMMFDEAEPTIDVGKQEVSLKVGVSFLIK